MNARKTTSKLCRTPALLALVLSLVAGNATAITYDLVALPFGKAMPDGSSVPMWGFALDVGNGSVPTVPGPALVVPAGDSSLTVKLRNGLTGPGAEPVSLVIPGQAMPIGLSPVKQVTDNTGRQRVRSFTTEAAPGAEQIYTWNNLKPGTYLYHSGTHPQVQVQMGLYGAVTRDAGSGQAYAGVPYQNQATLLFSEIDPALHLAVAVGQYGPGTAMTSTIDYAPKYFLINGVAHPHGSLDLTIGSTGQTTLLRLLNAGLQSRSPMLQGHYMRLVAEDGNPYPYAREQYSAFLPALKTVDAVITPAAAATYPIYDRRLADGMLAFLTVTDGSGAIPGARDDGPYFTDEDTQLVVPLPGVLDNDDAGTTASRLSGPSHGTLSLAADGGFIYMPALNFNGADSFTYQAVSGGVPSLPATVSLTVNPVNDPPVAANNAYSIIAGGTLNVDAPGVLTNDSDVDGDALSAVNPSTGFSLSADGSFSYTAPLTGGTHNFTYQASDGVLSSNTATVTITVLANRPPVAVKDTFNVARNATAVPLNVLANDSDPDGNLDPSVPGTVQIMVLPNKGGTATVITSGPDMNKVSYTPKLNFRGSENFSYRVRDSGGLYSSTVIVKVNVK